MRDLEDQIRGSGRTTRQMQAAPQGAVFIWCNDHTFYARSLACHLRRLDLKIIGPREAETFLKGRRRTVVICDHALELNRRLATEIVFAQSGAAA